MNLPRWSITLVLLLAFTVFAMAGENGMNAYTEGWSETHPTAGDVYWAAAGPFDFDGDGYPEFVGVTDAGGITVIMYENNGDDSFENVWTYVIADVIYSRDVADQTSDLDGDGIPELLIAGKGNTDYNSVFIFEYDTSSTDMNFNLVGSLDPEELAGLVSESGTDAKTLMAGDLDNDGIDELLISDGGGTDFVMVMSLDTNSTFAFPNWIVEYIDQSMSYSNYGGVIGDFDNNGTNNFAFVEWDYNAIAFYDVLGVDDYELILFTDDITPDDGGSQRSVEAADLNGDGYTEIYLASTNGNVYVYEIGDDLADFDLETDIHIIFEDTDNVWQFGGAKLGNTDIWWGPADGADYIITDRDSSAIIDLEYDGVGDVFSAASWTPYYIATDVASWQDVVLGDFDYDGLDEFIAVTTEATLAQVFEHDGWNWAPGVETSPIVADTSSVNPVTPGFQTRGVTAGSDLDGDGMQEVLVTDYTVHGLHIYEVTGDNTLEWRNTLTVDSTTYGSNVRFVITGDLDNNGVGEIIFMSFRDAAEAGNGLNVWEWDGVVGSDNYTQYVMPVMVDGVVVDRYYGDRTINVGDPDGDGQQEVMISNNGNTGSTYDIHMIAHVDGTFASGFYSLVPEWVSNKDAPEWGGSPGYGQPNVTDLDGDGDKEVCFLSWNNNTLLVVESLGTDDYAIQSSTMIDSSGSDDVVYGSTYVTDIDGDGIDELYGPQYSLGWVWQVRGGDDVADITFENGVEILSHHGAPWDLTGGDSDGDGVDELYAVDYSHARILQWSYNGTGWDEAVVANWTETMGGFGLDFADDLDGDGRSELVQGFLEPPYSVGNPMGYTFSVTELGGAVGVEEKWTIITPDDYKLEQNYPNPFNPSTTIEFTLPLAKDNINIIVYNMLGQEVVRLASDASYGPGTHSITWNSITAAGTPAAAGVYIYELRSGHLSKTAKMTLIK
ncbi:MAG: VCBS repeat-containing protein [Candidatus Marinimicrobia bacterium]|nr:VCBS repeat-containing protein [Candidatus Neomarinimicrobiota bacterium]